MVSRALDLPNARHLQQRCNFVPAFRAGYTVLPSIDNLSSKAIPAKESRSRREKPAKAAAARPQAPGAVTCKEQRSFGP